MAFYAAFLLPVAHDARSEIRSPRPQLMRRYLVGKLYADQKRPHGTNQHGSGGGVETVSTPQAPKTAEKIAASEGVTEKIPAPQGGGEGGPMT